MASVLEVHEGRPDRPRRWNGRSLSLPLTIVAFLLGWEFSVRLLEVQTYILPTPSAVAWKVFQDLRTGTIVGDFAVTLIEVLCGFAIAAIAGIAIGSAIALVGFLERTIYPFILAIQTIPKIALAPLFLIWFGYGLQSKVLTAALIALFPILVNVISGMRTIDDRRILLMRSLNASSMTIFLKARLPSMLPHLFAGLEVGIIFSVMGAIVGEFIGSSRGLGCLIVQRQASVDVAGVFSVLVYLSFMGIGLNLVLRSITKRYAFWSRSGGAVGA
jgi:NitT/TauT family transport system permease protein